MEFSCDVVEKLVNTPPLIKEIIAQKNICNVGDTVWVKVDASDPENDPITCTWSANGGFFISKQGEQVDWVAPKTSGVFTLKVTVSDDKGGETEDQTTVTVLSQEKPTIRITEPQDGAYITGLGNLRIIVDAKPADYIAVDFYLNNMKSERDLSPPFNMDLPLQGLSGMMRIKAVAYRLDAAYIQAADSVQVSIQGVITIPKKVQ